MLAQPELQFLAGAQVAESVTDGCHGLAVHAQECLRVVQPIADHYREDLTSVRSRRQRLTGEPPVPVSTRR